MYNGQGKLYSTFVYEGGWLNGMRHGQGKEQWTDGATYEGNYEYNCKNGNGKFTFPDGSFYIG